MSTTIKRVALVAVAALGLGVMSVAPSNAKPQADSFSISSATASTTVGTAVTVDATVAFLQETSSDSITVTASYDAAPAGITVGETVWSSISAVTTDLGTPTVDTSTARVAIISAATAASLNKTLTLKLTPTKAGTYVIRLTPSITGSTSALLSTYKTWTVTVSAKTVAWKSAFLGAAGTIATDTQTADGTVSVTAAASTTAKARLDVGQGYGSTSGSDTATAADAKSVVVATDKGLVSKTNDYTAAAKSVTLAAGTDADSTFFVFSNGDVGKASITVTIDGALYATKNVTFTGAATSVVATAATSSDVYTKVSGNSTWDITATDVAGSTVTNPSGLTVKSSDTSVATVAISGNNSVVVTGVKAGTATITVTDPATSSAATAATFTATVKTVRPTTAPTITFDKSAYNVGDLVTMTVNADMADSATAQLFTAALVTSSSVVASGTALPNSGAHAIVGGKATYKFYAPAVSGTFTVTGTTGGAVDITTAATVTKTVDIVNVAVDAATDAANEAAQNASDATDAALAAADAADLATAAAQDAALAVADLSAKVDELIKALKAQITTLTNLVIKIQKKVKA